jgi:hypothetical protein
MNSDTFASFSATYPSGHPFNLPAAITTTTTTETAFLLGNGTQAIIHVPVGTEILGAQTPFSVNANPVYSAESGRAGKWLGETRPFFNSSSFNNRGFRLRAMGYIAGGGTTLTSISASINIYAGITGATVTAGTEIANVAITGGVGNSKANWLLECNLMWDSVTQQLNGFRSGFIGNLLTSASVASAVTPVASLALTSLAFGFTYVFATTSTANTVGLTELSLDQY